MVVRGRLGRKAGEHRVLGRRPAWRVLAVVLAGALVFAGVVAADGVLVVGSSAAGTVSVSGRGSLPPGVRVLRELPALRSASSDTFLLSDGSREVVVHDRPVNYRSAAGSWQPIDDALRQASGGAFGPVASGVASSAMGRVGSCIR